MALSTSLSDSRVHRQALESIYPRCREHVPFTTWRVGDLREDVGKAARFEKEGSIMAVCDLQ